MARKGESGRGFSTLPTREKAIAVARFLDDGKARDVAALDVTSVSPICEAIVIAGATSARHAQGMADNLLDMVSGQNIEYLGMEGYRQGEWILVDLNDVLVHIFKQDLREFYNLEGLWSEGEPIPWKSDAD